MLRFLFILRLIFTVCPDIATVGDTWDSTTRLSVFMPGAGDILPFETDLSVQSHETLQLVNVDEAQLQIYAPNLFICNCIVAEIHVLNGTAGIKQPCKVLQGNKYGNTHNQRQNGNCCSSTYSNHNQ